VHECVGQGLSAWAERERWDQLTVCITGDPKPAQACNTASLWPSCTQINKAASLGIDKPRFPCYLFVSGNGNDTGSANGPDIMASNRHVTIKQVAEKAGVSIQTISRVLNKRPDVSPETRKRVQEIIESLGYRPFSLARGLASKRTFTLGLISPDFTDYWFAQVATAAEAEAHEHGYFFMLGTTGMSSRDEPKFSRLLTERHVEGILFIRAEHIKDFEHLRNLQQSGIPVVSTGFYLPGSEFSFIEVDNLDGARQATQHLLNLGHRQIATITGPEGLSSVENRTQGYLRALQSAGVEPNPELIIPGKSWWHRAGYDGTKALLNKKVAFTAVFAHNDRLARGAMMALNEAGLNVPQDISIVGYDDIPEAEFADPPLTTMRQPMRAVGQAAAHLLITLIEDPNAAPQQLLFNTELVSRSSCAALTPNSTSIRVR
jgi:DNA-binding LacI/PurR family transcriptional regulator